MCSVLTTSEYTPNPAAAIKISAIRIPTPVPSLLLFAPCTSPKFPAGEGASGIGADGVGVATATPPPDSAAAAIAADPLPPLAALLCAEPVPPLAAGVLPESLSGCSRFKSDRISAATW